MNRVNIPLRMHLTVSILLLMAAPLACNKKSAPTSSGSVPGSSLSSAPNVTDARRLSEGANKLMEAMKNPTSSFRFSFQGQERTSDSASRDETQTPKVGPIALQADISPDEIDLTETRGGSTKTSKAKKGDEMGMAMANLTVLGLMTGPNLVIALGSSVAQPPTTDLVGAASADKFVFDTSTATPAQKMGLQAARLILTSIKECKGTAWIAKDSGLLIKFNIDADYQDKNNHAWKEHYEGDVVPK